MYEALISCSLSGVKFKNGLCWCFIFYNYNIIWNFETLTKEVANLF